VLHRKCFFLSLIFTLAIDHMKYNYPYLIGISLATALGGLLFGFDISVISGTVTFLQEYFSLSEAAKGWVVSSALIGCIIGSTIGGRLGDRFGRRIILKVCAVLFIVSALGSGLAKIIPSFLFFRIVGGLAVGGASVLAPVYIAEVSPAQLRGRMVSINQLTIVLGISLAYYSNYFLLKLGPDSWRWMFAAEALPALLFLFGLFFIPDSPRWLVKRGKDLEAKRILSRISPSGRIDDLMNDIRESLQADKGQTSFRDIFRPGLRRVLFLGIFLAVFQQWCGINVIFFYAPDIFSSLEVDMDVALFRTTLIGLVNVVFTFIAIWLIDKIGRKVLMISGSIIMTIGYILISYFIKLDVNNYLLLSVILLTAGAFASTLGPVVWVIISEIFPNRLRGTGMAIATFFLWSACYILTLSFPVLAEGFGRSATFLIYAGICLAGAIYMIFRLPETKGKSLEELESLLVNKKIA